MLFGFCIIDVSVTLEYPGGACGFATTSEQPQICRKRGLKFIICADLLDLRDCSFSFHT